MPAATPAPRVPTMHLVAYVLCSSLLGLGFYTLAILVEEGPGALVLIPAVWLASPLADAVFVVGSALVGLLAYRVALARRAVAAVAAAFAGTWLVYAVSFMLLPPGVGLWEPTSGVWPKGNGVDDWQQGFLVTLLYGWLGLAFATAAPVVAARRAGRGMGEPGAVAAASGGVDTRRPFVAAVALAIALALAATMAAYAIQGEHVAWLFDEKPSTSGPVLTQVEAEPQGAGLLWAALTLVALLSAFTARQAWRGRGDARLPVLAFVAAGWLGVETIMGTTPFVGAALLALAVAGAVAMEDAWLRERGRREVVVAEKAG